MRPLTPLARLVHAIYVLNYSYRYRVYFTSYAHDFPIMLAFVEARVRGQRLEYDFFYRGYHRYVP
jgi:hypothetical protein